MSEAEKTPEAEVPKQDTEAPVEETKATEETKVAEEPEEAPEEEKAEETKAAETTVPLEEAESKTGIKEEGINQEAVDMAKDAEHEPENEPALPSFFVEEEDRLKVEVDVLFDKDDGKLVAVSRSGILEDSQFEALGFTTEWLSSIRLATKR